HVAGHKLGKRVSDGDNRFAEVVIFHARGTPKGTCACHVTAMSGSFRTIIRHEKPQRTLRKTFELRWKLYSAWRSSGRAVTGTGSNPCCKNQCAVCVVRVNNWRSPCWRAAFSMKVSSFWPRSALR